jgi:hypothetical protein
MTPALLMHKFLDLWGVVWIALSRGAFFLRSSVPLLPENNILGSKLE